MNVGLIAHDSKKKLMQNFCIAYRGVLGKHSLFATGTTGRLIEEATNLSVHKFLPGPLGGLQQMSVAIVSSSVIPSVLTALISIRSDLSKYASPVIFIDGSDARIPEKNATPSATIKRIEIKRPKLWRISI